MSFEYDIPAGVNEIFDSDKNYRIEDHSLELSKSKFMDLFIEMARIPRENIAYHTGERVVLIHRSFPEIVKIIVCSNGHRPDEMRFLVATVEKELFLRDLRGKDLRDAISRLTFSYQEGVA